MMNSRVTRVTLNSVSDLIFRYSLAVRIPMETDVAMFIFFAISTMILFQVGLALLCFYMKQAKAALITDVTQNN